MFTTGQNGTARHDPAIRRRAAVPDEAVERSVGGFLGLGETKFLIPVDAVTRATDDAVHIDQSRERVASGPRYDPKLEEQRHWEDVHGYYGYDPYLGARLRLPTVPLVPVGCRGGTGSGSSAPMPKPEQPAPVPPPRRSVERPRRDRRGRW